MLTDTIGTLIHQQLITLEVVAQDGLRVRASAGGSSFRRQPSLKKCRDEARAQVRKLREESEREADSDASHARREAARLRAATERDQRIARALEELPKLRAEGTAEERLGRRGSRQHARGRWATAAFVPLTLFFVSQKTECSLRPTARRA